jgi:AcrR family transcriptional regulator
MLAQAEKTRDLRVRRTRMMIQQAFMELLEEKGFQSITIQEIADRAMVNRATFYDHFADKYALAEYLMREWFRQVLEQKLPADFRYCAGNLQFLIAAVCDFLEQIDAHCGPLNSQAFPPHEKQIASLVGEYLLKWLHSPEEEIMVASPELTAEVVSWAIYGAALHWNQKKRQTESAADFAERATSLITPLLN